MPKKVLIALSPAMLNIVDDIARFEHRTRSDMIREALRRYIETFRKSHTRETIDEMGWQNGDKIVSGTQFARRD